jgi:SWI/SNF chromatin-remodeling complex subunit SWI1
MQANGSASVALMLEQMYTAVLYPFEDLYKKNIQEQQRKAQLSRQMSMGQPGQMPRMPPNGMQSVSGQMQQMQRGPNPPMGMMGQPIPNVNGAHFVNPANHTPQTPQQRPGSTALNPQLSHNIQLQQNTPQPGAGPSGDSNLLDNDIQGIKRKLDAEDAEGKRTRQKTGKLLLTSYLLLLLIFCGLDPIENGSVSGIFLFYFSI